MKNFLKLIAVSAGGGLLLGAGIRFTETRRLSPRPADTEGKRVESRLDFFLERLEKMEKRLAVLDQSGTQPIGDIASVTKEESLAEKIPSNDYQKKDLQNEIGAQIDAMESRLRKELALHQDDLLKSMGETWQKRLSERIGHIEEELASQQAAVGELREYSLRTEKSLHRLLEGIDKLVASQASSRVPARTPTEAAL